MLHLRSSAFLTFCAGALWAGVAGAQVGPQAPGPGGYPAPAPPPSGWSAATPPPYAGAPYGGPQPYAGAQPYAASPYANPPSTASDAEVGTLYGFSVAYGVGSGIWLDAVLGIDDPGLQFLPPAILGVAAPVGVFFLNRPRMPRGMPAAIATGMFLGTGEAVGFAGYQFAHAQPQDEISFRGFSSAVFAGSTLGAVGGYVTAVTMEPSPKTSLLLASSVTWGTVVGAMYGYGSSTSGTDWSAANDTAALGGLIGFNVGLVGAAALSTVWVPTYESLSWMWIGFGAGLAAGLPVYLFYAGGDHDARRGLIVQGTLGMLGLAAGAIFTIDTREIGLRDARTEQVAAASPGHEPRFQITGGGPMAVRSGLGFQVSGIIF